MASIGPGSSQHTLPASDNELCQSLNSECRATCNRDLEIGLAWTGWKVLGQTSERLG